MSRRSNRRKPSSPAEILARNALQRGERSKVERLGRGNPSLWGIAEGIEQLPANQDMVVVRDADRRSRIRHARRSDAFTLVSMTDDQERAAGRYVRDWMIRVGASVDDDTFLKVVVDCDGGSGGGPTVRQLKAGDRIVAAHADVGRSSAKLLEALVEPLAVHGTIRVWRVVVQEVTGETERHAQAAAVRQACENLHLHYKDSDKKAAADRKARDYAGGGSS